jgi:glyoxylase-like metal-dependent hydrolase (beta-lactamase superfamily II)
MQGATVIAHSEAARRLEEDLVRREEPLDHRLPTERVTDRRILHVSGHEVRIFHLPAAHTDGDLVVHFVDANVIQTGDLFVQGSFPYISGGSGGSISGYIAAQEKILQLCDAHTRLIPGHGEVTDADELKATLAMLKTARDRVAKLKDRGQSLEQVVATDPLGDMQARWATGWITSTKMAEFVYTTLGAPEPAPNERRTSDRE